MRSSLPPRPETADSLLAEYQIQHPAAAPMRPRPAQVTDHRGVLTPALLKRVCQNEQPVLFKFPRGQQAMIVCRLRQGNGEACQRRNSTVAGVERVSKQVAHNAQMEPFAVFAPTVCRQRDAL